MADFTLRTVDADNVEELGFFCVKNRKHVGYDAKVSWLRRRFEEGLRIKLIVTEAGKHAGFVEYIPGEATWRVVEAPGYLVIHCLWVQSRHYPLKGMTAALLGACREEARAQGKEGVAVVTSEGAWMAGQAVFLKHGYERVDAAAPHFQLLVDRVGGGAVPAFPQNWEERLGRYPGLHLLYTPQCPFIGKAVAALPAVAERHGIRLELTEFQEAAVARREMPSPYGMINLVHAGRLLADHPISATRFKNILKKDLKLEERG